jgi:hypothetical protein
VYPAHCCLKVDASILGRVVAVRRNVHKLDLSSPSIPLPEHIHLQEEVSSLIVGHLKRFKRVFVKNLSLSPPTWESTLLQLLSKIEALLNHIPDMSQQGPERACFHLLQAGLTCTHLHSSWTHLDSHKLGREDRCFIAFYQTHSTHTSFTKGSLLNLPSWDSISMIKYFSASRKLLVPCTGERAARISLV